MQRCNISQVLEGHALSTHAVEKHLLSERGYANVALTGDMVSLSMAIAKLEKEPRSRSISERMYYFREKPGNAKDPMYNHILFAKDDGISYSMLLPLSRVMNSVVGFTFCLLAVLCKLMEDKRGSELTLSDSIHLGFLWFTGMWYVGLVVMSLWSKASPQMIMSGLIIYLTLGLPTVIICKHPLLLVCVVTQSCA